MRQSARPTQAEDREQERGEEHLIPAMTGVAATMASRSSLRVPNPCRPRFQTTTPRRTARRGERPPARARARAGTALHPLEPRIPFADRVDAERAAAESQSHDLRADDHEHRADDSEWKKNGRPKTSVSEKTAAITIGRTPTITRPGMRKRKFGL